MFKSTTDDWVANFYLKKYGQLQKDAEDKCNVTLNGSIFTIDLNKKINRISFTDGNLSGNLQVTINYSDASAQSNTVNASMNLNYQSMLASESLPIKTVEISASDNWTKEINNLPAYDANGNKYYYWVVEEDVSGYTASYYFDDANVDTDYCINATQLGNGEITIKNTKNESSSVEMPSTGGKGVKWYYVTGMAVMFVSAAGILIRRRKNPVK